MVSLQMDSLYPAVVWLPHCWKLIILLFVFLVMRSFLYISSSGEHETWLSSSALGQIFECFLFIKKKKKSAYELQLVLTTQSYCCFFLSRHITGTDSQLRRQLNAMNHSGEELKRLAKLITARRSKTINSNVTISIYCDIIIHFVETHFENCLLLNWPNRNVWRVYLRNLKPD